MLRKFLGAALSILAGAVVAKAQEALGPLPTIQGAPAVAPRLDTVGTAPWNAFESPSPRWMANDGTPQRYWVGAEYLMWWIKGASVPPLLTSGTPASIGILGLPGTQTISDDTLNYGLRSGGRFSAGAWLNCDQTKGIELGYLFLTGGNNRFVAGGDGGPNSAVISRPYINAITGLPDVELVAFPGIVGGTVTTSSGSFLQGADANLICNLCSYAPCPSACPSACPTDCLTADCSPTTCCTRNRAPASYRVDFLAGPRWMQLQENLQIQEQLVDALGNQFTVTDRFTTSNNFYGGQVGLRGQWQRGRYFLSLLGKVALGNNHQQVRIDGNTVITPAGGQQVVQPGGLLALPSNIGSYSRDQFSVIPEVNANIGYQLTDRLRVTTGYSFLYWSNVVRPGDQIDTVVNPTQLPTAFGPGQLIGPARPAFQFNQSGFWAQGISFGIQYNW
jgi:hypothetical protein